MGGDSALLNVCVGGSCSVLGIQIAAVSSDTEPKSPYDQLGHVPERPVAPSVYLQLIADNADEQQQVPTTSVARLPKRAVVMVSQPLDGDGEPVTDSVQ